METYPGGIWSEALAINGAGVAVGFATVDNLASACRWENGLPIELKVPIGPDSMAGSVNDNNQIVGWMGVYPVGNFFAEAFLWENGVAFSLGKPEGANFSTANAINNQAQVCGYYGVPGVNPWQGNVIYHPLLWSKGQMIDLGILPGTIDGYAEGINDEGVIVGSSHKYTPPQDHKGFVWRDGEMLDLEDLLPPEYANHRILGAHGINNSGQIAVSLLLPGGPQLAALLTPVPAQPGDVNCDWLVNIDDLFEVIAAWGPCGELQPCSADLDPPGGNGTIDIDDLFTVINGWT